jgi:hypothetical protein
MLGYSMLCYVRLGYVTLCYVILWYVMVCFVMYVMLCQVCMNKSGIFTYNFNIDCTVDF